MEAFVGEREEDVILAGVIAVNRRGAVLDALGDLSDGDVGVAFDEEELTGGVENGGRDACRSRSWRSLVPMDP